MENFKKLAKRRYLVSLFIHETGSIVLRASDKWPAVMGRGKLRVQAYVWYRSRRGVVSFVDFQQNIDRLRSTINRECASGPSCRVCVRVKVATGTRPHEDT